MKILKPKHVLIVDDDDDMRSMIQDTILNHFYEESKNITITEAPEGLTALKKITEQRYDLVITDLVMPKLSKNRFNDD